jgi:hypothetical protein
MTEQEWQEAIDPRPMLRWLSSRIGAREAMRFAYSCCDRVRALIHDPRSVRALDVLQLAITEGVDRSVIHAVATEAQQAAWLAVRVFCVPILGEEEFNRRIRMARTGPDEFERMASVDPVYLAAEAAKHALWCASDPSNVNVEVASRYAAEAIARSSTDVDKARVREWAAQAALLRQIVESAGAFPWD